jgi:hypothetical protein
MMKCPRCQNPIVVGFNDCVVCQKNTLYSEPIAAKYFIVGCTLVFGILSLFNLEFDIQSIFKSVWVSMLGGLFWGSIIWLFYGIFRRGKSA